MAGTATARTAAGPTSTPRRRAARRPPDRSCGRGSRGQIGERERAGAGEGGDAPRRTARGRRARVITKAKLAERGASRSRQWWPISAHEQAPTSSQPMSSVSRSAATTSNSIAPTNSSSSATSRAQPAAGSCAAAKTQHRQRDRRHEQRDHGRRQRRQRGLQRQRAAPVPASPLPAAAPRRQHASAQRRPRQRAARAMRREQRCARAAAAASAAAAPAARRAPAASASSQIIGQCFSVVSASVVSAWRLR